jgi:hypothetical protein
MSLSRKELLPFVPIVLGYSPRRPPVDFFWERRRPEMWPTSKLSSFFLTINMSMSEDLSMTTINNGIKWTVWPKSVEVIHSKYGLSNTPTFSQIIAATQLIASPDDHPGFVLDSSYSVPPEAPKVDSLILWEQMEKAEEQWIEGSQGLSSEQISQSLNTYYQLEAHRHGYSVLGRKRA